MNHENKSKYSAFISYKRDKVDSKAAIKLQKYIEAYRVPRVLRKNGLPKQLKPVFLDNTELSVSTSLPKVIENNLNTSGYLIVICSPRTNNSYWVKKEINYFLSLGRKDKIILLLIEGTPESSFPEQLKGSNPLAADIRSKRKKPKFNLLKLESLRIISKILGCNFSDLKKRDEIRRKRLTVIYIIGSTVISIALISLTMYSLYKKNEAEESLNFAEKQKRIAEGANRDFIDLSVNLIKHSDEARKFIVEIFKSDFEKVKKLLKGLVKNSSSMNDKDRDSWETIINNNMMTESQLLELLDILTVERTRDAVFDRSYNKKKQVSGKSQSLFDEGVKYMNSNDPQLHKKAENIFKKIMKEDKYLGGAHYALAKLYKSQGKLVEAETILKEGISFRDLPMYHSGLGDIYTIQKNTNLAIKHYKTAIDGGYHQFLTYVGYGKNLISNKFFLEGVKAYEEALKLVPKNETEKGLKLLLYFEVSEMYSKLGYCDKALEFANEGVKRFPGGEKGKGSRFVENCVQKVN